MTEESRAMGSVIGAGGSGTFGRIGFRMGATGSEAAGEKFVANRDASRLSGGVSTCCVVELKYRARLGRRKVGGKADTGIFVSSIDRLIVLLSILRFGDAVEYTQCLTGRGVAVVQSFWSLGGSEANAQRGMVTLKKYFDDKLVIKFNPPLHPTPP